MNLSTLYGLPTNLCHGKVLQSLDATGKRTSHHRVLQHHVMQNKLHIY